jgi:type II secretory pathway component PulF
MPKTRPTIFSRVPDKYLALFCRTLHTMLRAGVPITKTLENAEKNAGNYLLRGAVRGLRRDIEEGTSLAEAFQKQNRRFPPVMVRLLAVGERSGTVDKVAIKLADYYDERRRLKRMVLVSLIYPALQLFVLGLVITVLAWFGLVPVSPELVLIVMFFSVPVGFWIWFMLDQIESLKMLLQVVLMGLPLAGRHIRTIAGSRMAMALALELEAGIPIIQALADAGLASENIVFERRLRAAQDAVAEGESLTEALGRTGLFDGSFMAIIETREHAGSLVEGFERLAETMHERAMTATRAMAILFSWLIYAGVALVIIYFIITLWGQYIGQMP